MAKISLLLSHPTLAHHGDHCFLHSKERATSSLLAEPGYSLATVSFLVGGKESVAESSTSKFSFQKCNCRCYFFYSFRLGIWQGRGESYSFLIRRSSGFAFGEQSEKWRSCKINVRCNLSNLRKSVSSDIRTLRSGLKKPGAAEVFLTSKCVDI